jgi:uncharacterized membrane protein
VIARMVDALATIEDETNSPDQSRVLLRQAEAIFRSADKSVLDPNDLDDMRARYRRLIRTASPIGMGSSPAPSGGTT